MIGIYAIINNINNKKYIGQSINIERRFKEHHHKPFNKNSKMFNTPIYKAIRKYGFENFSFVILEECTKKELDKRERYWINYYETNDSLFGYNQTEGGSAVKPLKLNKREVNEIKKLLKNTDLSQMKIAEKFNIDQKTVSFINTGTLWVDEKEVYPLRKIQFKKKKYFCKFCGREVYKNNDTCHECAVLLFRKVERPSREVLKEEIRNNSFLGLSKKYGVSDNAIRKWCKYYNLPYQVTEIKKFSDDDWRKI